MKQSQPSAVISNVYWPIFRRHAHLLIAWGHKAIQPKLRATNEDDEESITGLLAEAIEDILRAERAPWCSGYDIANEAPISGGNRLGKDRRKTDLFIKFIRCKGRPKYIFEAKPQNYIKIHQRTSYYVGVKGMERFLDGEYADYTADYPEVGMIAYVLSDTVEVWRDRLKKAIDQQQIPLRLVAPQEDVVVVDEIPFEWCSQHMRSSSNNLLSIYHVLLDCTTN
jgi:hypothetical protein